MRYIRQALALMREERLYSAMYIAGTALAVAFVMLIAEVYYIKMADIAPEVNRSKTYYLAALGIGKDAAKSAMHEDLHLFQEMKTPEYMTAVAYTWDQRKICIKMPDNIHEMEANPKMTDPTFFSMYQFHFIEGAPYSHDDFDNHRHVVVITEDVAEHLFGKGAKAVGKTIHFCHTDYRVCGVVQTPSALLEVCSADIWVPYSAEGLTEEIGLYSLVEVPIQIYFSVPANQREAFKKEIKKVEARYNSMHPDDTVDMTTFLISHYESVWQTLCNVFDTEPDNIFWFLLPSILLLLFVPALNLSGMVASRMDRRLPEMAIRKAFGAKRLTLLGQVITENLILTLIGGTLGLSLAWTALYAWRDWVFHVFAGYNYFFDYSGVPIIRGEMLFGPTIFLISLLVCGLLNVLAATLPAWISLRKPIVESMGLKK